MSRYRVLYKSEQYFEVWYEPCASVGEAFDLWSSDVADGSLEMIEPLTSYIDWTDSDGDQDRPLIHGATGGKVTLIAIDTNQEGDAGGVFRR